MSAFQRFSLCLDGFQHVSFSAFARAGFSFCPFEFQLLLW
jgi:hypothetical protein